MTALDIIVILLVGYGLFQGVRRGFLFEVLSLGVWVAVVLALWALHGPLSRALTGVIGTVSGAHAFAFALILIVVLFGGKMLARSVSRGVRNSFIGPADRVLGAGFGALKGLVFATLFYMGFSFLYDMLWGRDEARPHWIADAVTYPLVHATSDTFVNLTEARRGAEAAPAPAPAPAEKQRPARRK